MYAGPAAEAAREGGGEEIIAECTRREPREHRPIRQALRAGRQAVVVEPQLDQVPECRGVEQRGDGWVREPALHQAEACERSESRVGELPRGPRAERPAAPRILALYGQPSERPLRTESPRNVLN